jgi:enamine deaminase RidA (YjgF/YER057c/UK114 family)
MTDIQRIDAGPRMSEAVIHGGKIYSAGVIADTTAGKPAYEQTVDILGQIDALLERAGSNKQRILKVNIWLADMQDFAEMNRAWDAWVVPNHTPARATVESKLCGPEYRVEMMFEAAL